jgi:hypothetical protein
MGATEEQKSDFTAFPCAAFDPHSCAGDEIYALCVQARVFN